MFSMWFLFYEWNANVLNLNLLTARCEFARDQQLLPPRIVSRRSCEKYLTDTWAACPITTSILPIYMYIMKLATVACVQRPRLRPRPLPQRQTFLNEANNLQTKDEKWVFEILRLGVTFCLEENDIRSKFLDKYLRYISFTFSAIIKCSFYSHTKA